MEDKTPKCSSSEHSKLDASIFFQTCKIFLCNKCQNNFHSKIFSNHQINNLSHEKKDDIFTNICYEKNHLNQLEYFCRNHNKLYCAKCITKIKDKNNGQPKDCNIISLNEIKIEKEKIFKENCNKLQKISNNLESNINKFKALKEQINKNKEELIINIQKAFTKIRTDLNEREDKLITEVGEIYSKNYFYEKIIKESEKLPSNIKNCLEYGFQIKNKWDKEEELSDAINCSIEFENNLNKIDEMNENMAKCNSSKTKISFKITKEKIEEDIAELGFIVVNDEKDEEYEKEIDEKSDKEPEEINDSKKSERSKSSRKSSISSKRSKNSISDDED